MKNISFTQQGIFVLLGVLCVSSCSRDDNIVLPDDVTVEDINDSTDQNLTEDSDTSSDTSEPVCNPLLGHDCPCTETGAYCCYNHTPYECSGRWSEVHDAYCGGENSPYPYEDAIGECTAVWFPQSVREYPCNMANTGATYCPCEESQVYCCDGGQDGRVYQCELFEHPFNGVGHYWRHIVAGYCGMPDYPVSEDHVCPATPQP